MTPDVRPGDRVQLRPDGEVLTVVKSFGQLDGARACLQMPDGNQWDMPVALIFARLPRCPEVGATVGSVEELDALPDGSWVARDDETWPMVRFDGRWLTFAPGGTRPFGLQIAVVGWAGLVGARVLRVGGGT